MKGASYYGGAIGGEPMRHTKKSISANRIKTLMKKKREKKK